MRVRHIHGLDDRTLRAVEGLACAIFSLEALVRTEFRTMSAALDRLTREVSETKEVAASAVAMIEGLAQQIRDLKDDPAALEALANELDASQAALAAAVAANTPSEPGGEETTGGDTSGSDTTSDTVVGGEGEDTLPAGDGDDVIEPDEP